MNTFLFTWNPNKWEWQDLQKGITQIESIGFYERRWSCGNSKKIRQGDRAFLMRLGENPKGIMGSGYAKSSYYQSEHWDGTPQKLTNYIDIEFDVLLNPNSQEILSSDALELIKPELRQRWFPEQSGIQLKDGITEPLEELWINFINDNGFINHSFIFNQGINGNIDSYIEGDAIQLQVTRYERNPFARRRCLEYYGYDCVICDFNFGAVYGRAGEKYIHVHHVNPIAKIGKRYKIDPVQDLRPVCANCHSIVHRRNPAYSIEDIKNMISK